MNNDDLEVVSGLDQPMPLDLSVQPSLIKLDEIYETAVNSGNYADILSLINNICVGSRLMGIALAKVLYRFYSDWDKFNIQDDFFDVVYDRTGRSKATISRYILVWKMYEDKLMPERYEDRIMSLPIRSQISISAALDQGYEIQQEDWKVLAHSEDVSTVMAKIREIKGADPKKGTMVLVLKRSGNLVASMDGQMKSVGMLVVDSDDELVQKALNRIIDKSGIIRE